MKLSEWFSDIYWHLRNVLYFRFSEYNDNIDRLAFFEELCYGWKQMYSWDLMEDEQKALKAVDKLYAENGDALQRLAEIERKELNEESD